LAVNRFERGALVRWGIGLDNGHATTELFSCRAFHARLVECGSCWAPMALHEHPHSGTVPVSGRSTAVPWGKKDAILSETIENRAQTPCKKAVPSTYFEPVLTYWSRCWTGRAQKLGVKPNQRYWTILSAAMSVCSRGFCGQSVVRSP